MGGGSGDIVNAIQNVGMACMQTNIKVKQSLILVSELTVVTTQVSLP